MNSLLFLVLSSYAAIFGKDDRKIISPHVIYPFTTVGRVDYTISEMRQIEFHPSGSHSHLKKRYGSCLGTVLGKNLVLTNARCAERISKDSGIFTPGFHDDLKPFGSFHVRSVIIPKGWEDPATVHAHWIEMCNKLHGEELSSCARYVQSWSDVAMLIVDDLPIEKIGQAALLSSISNEESILSFLNKHNLLTLSRVSHQQAYQFCNYKDWHANGFLKDKPLHQVFDNCDLTPDDRGAAQFGYDHEAFASNSHMILLSIHSIGSDKTLPAYEKLPKRGLNAKLNVSTPAWGHTMAELIESLSPQYREQIHYSELPSN